METGNTVIHLFGYLLRHRFRQPILKEQIPIHGGKQQRVRIQTSLLGGKSELPEMQSVEVKINTEYSANCANATDSRFLFFRLKNDWECKMAKRSYHSAAVEMRLDWGAGEPNLPLRLLLDSFLPISDGSGRGKDKLVVTQRERVQKREEYPPLKCNCRYEYYLWQS
jgi:hypothetical protein